jgi:tRNA threonylcarbamoyladenosine biosynthesis protein TsaB
MKILALEFSSPIRSVAVAVDGRVCGFAEERGGKGSSAFALIESVLRDSELRREEIEALAVGVGPGSYAGIRIAIAIAKGWQLARGVRLIGLGSADCVAAQAVERGAKGTFSVVIDAQRGELFRARYERGEAGPRLVAPFQLAVDPSFFNETVYRPDLLETNLPEMIALPPSATTLARLASARNDFVSGGTMAPIYLRPAEFVKAPTPKIRAP